MSPTSQDDISEPASAIRMAWRLGNDRIEINGRLFQIRRSDHRVVIERKGELPLTRVESWLIARPVGAQLPLYNIELDPGRNFRA